MGAVAGGSPVAPNVAEAHPKHQCNIIAFVIFILSLGGGTKLPLPPRGMTKRGG